MTVSRSADGCFTHAMMPDRDQSAAFFAPENTLPVVLINLLKFRPLAEYPDGRNAGMTGREAYAIFGAVAHHCLAQVGGRVLYSGDVEGMMIGHVDGLWDAVALAYYPSPQALIEMVALPDYRGIEVHRFAGLAGQLNIRTAPGMMP